MHVICRDLELVNIVLISVLIVFCLLSPNFKLFFTYLLENTFYFLLVFLFRVVNIINILQLVHFFRSYCKLMLLLVNNAKLNIRTTFFHTNLFEHLKFLFYSKDPHNRLKMLESY